MILYATKVRLTDRQFVTSSGSQFLNIKQDAGYIYLGSGGIESGDFFIDINKRVPITNDSNGSAQVNFLLSFIIWDMAETFI